MDAFPIVPPRDACPARAVSDLNSCYWEDVCWWQDSESSKMIFTDEQQEHLEHVISTYRGNGQELENALGALCLGMLYGHKVIRVMHNGRSYTKYQKILHLQFRDWCPDETLLSSRHRGYQLALKAQNFWDVVRGMEEPPEGFKEGKKEFA